jgi:hypothetical protein
MRFIAALALLQLLVSPAQAQQTSLDPVLLARMLSMTQTDRAGMLNMLTESQARAALLTDELARANARIKELEPKPDVPEKDDAPKP